MVRFLSGLFGGQGLLASQIGNPVVGTVGGKEQREKDRAAGLIPFAVKLNESLVAKLHALAEERKTGINELVAELLEKGMEK